MSPLFPWVQGGPGQADSPVGSRTALFGGVMGFRSVPTGSGLECPVCKDDYGLGERVRQLPCNHLFHDGCIVPWLEQVSERPLSPGLPAPPDSELLPSPTLSPHSMTAAPSAERASQDRTQPPTLRA